MNSNNLSDTEQVEANTPQVLTRDQRRLLDHLRNKFNFTDEDAFARAKGYKRKQKNPANTQPSKKAKSDPQTPAKAQSDCEGAKPNSSATVSSPQQTGNAAPAQATADKGNLQEKTVFPNKKPENLRPTETARKPAATSGKTQNGRKPTIPIADALKCQRLAIVGRTAFTDEQRNRIKDAICEVVLNDDTDSPPEFHGVMTKCGHLVATVADSESAQWLLEHQEEIAKESDCPLSIMTEDMVPPKKLYRAIFSHSSMRSTADIFKTLEKFSRDRSIHTSRWELVRRVEDGHASILYILVDEKSAEYINNCRNHALPFRLGHANFYREWAEEKKLAGGAKMIYSASTTVQKLPPTATKEDMECTPRGSERYCPETALNEP